MTLRTPSRCWRALTGALLAGLVLAGSPGSAQAERSAPTAPAPKGYAKAAISPDLDGVVVDGPEFRAAVGRVSTVRRSLNAARAALAAADARLAELAIRSAALDQQIPALAQQRKVAVAELAGLRAQRRELAVEAYMRGPDTGGLEELVAGAKSLAVGQERALFRSIDDETRTTLHRTRVRRDGVQRELSRAIVDREATRAQIVTTAAEREKAATDEQAFNAELLRRQAMLSDARAMTRVTGLDFTLVALDAYYKASLRMAAEKPACGLPWWAVAGISKVEGRHGTYGGATVLPDGQTSKKIIGIPLDGTNRTRAIADTDAGTLDGDPVVDRAVGPMQFIPGTWNRYKRDGNGDGKADPHNLYDATLAAAMYLCSGGPANDDAGMTTAFLRYNRSESYARTVLAWGKRYGLFQIPPPVPVVALAETEPVPQAPPTTAPG